MFLCVIIIFSKLILRYLPASGADQGTVLVSEASGGIKMRRTSSA